MRNATAAEWILRLVTAPDRAASTVGDLLEEAEERDSVWFWSSVLGTAASHVWEDLHVNWRRMAWLACSGLLEMGMFCWVLGMVWIPVWMAVSPYAYGPNSIYIPPWGFCALLIAMLTVVPLLVGWDVARRSRGRELGAGLALTSVLAAINALRAFSAGTLVRRNETPYPYEENLLIVFCAAALFVMAGAMLFRLRAMRSTSRPPRPASPRAARPLP